MSVKLLRRIERYLCATRTAPSAFGRSAARDPHFVYDLREGRKVRGALTDRVHAYLDEQEKMLEAAGCRRR